MSFPFAAGSGLRGLLRSGNRRFRRMLATRTPGTAPRQEDLAPLFGLEALEPRLLLSADPLTFALSGAVAHNITVHLSDDDDATRVRVFETAAPDDILKDETVAELTGFRLLGSAGDDVINLRIVSEAESLLPSFRLSVSGAEGDDSVNLLSVVGYTGALEVESETITVDASSLGTSEKRLSSVLLSAAVSDPAPRVGSPMERAVSVALHGDIFTSGALEVTASVLGQAGFAAAGGAESANALISVADGATLSAGSIGLSAEARVSAAWDFGTQTILDVQQQLGAVAQVSVGAGATLLSAGDISIAAIGEVEADFRAKTGTLAALLDGALGPFSPAAVSFDIDIIRGAAVDIGAADGAATGISGHNVSISAQSLGTVAARVDSEILGNVRLAERGPSDGETATAARTGIVMHNADVSGTGDVSFAAQRSGGLLASGVRAATLSAHDLLIDVSGGALSATGTLEAASRIPASTRRMCALPMYPSSACPRLRLRSSRVATSCRAMSVCRSPEQPLPV